ncbi:MAG: hypothetical protein AW07_02294 [Candidatus Accumulibacter sp. SK-11]|nr:MAG: hypothetical protein AW07_02294 [Candidatus Accumulibacter sp. SK-11]
MISSLALARISPVFSSITSSPITRPIRKSSGTATCFMPAASSSRMCLAVIRLSLAMISLPDESLKSKRATSPRKRSGTSANSVTRLPM